MRRFSLPLLLLAVASGTFAQSSLSTVIRGDNGATKHFVSLQQSQQVAFTPANAKSLLGLDANSDLLLVGTSKDNLGQTNYRFLQTYKGIPVEGAMYNAQTVAGKLTALSGAVITDFAGLQADKTATINSKQAIDAALRHVGASLYMWQDADMEKRIKAELGDLKASYAPSATLVWYSGGGRISPRNLSLCYKVNVYAAQPLSNAYYFVDAKTNKVIAKHDLIHNYEGGGGGLSAVPGIIRTLYSGVRDITCTFDGDSTYALRDFTRGHGVFALDRKGNDYESNSARFRYPLPDRNAFDAFWGAVQTYDFYKNSFNRNSINDDGYHLVNYVNEVGLSLFGGNAFWDGYAMHYGHIGGTKDGVTSIDVIGHEITHGVTQNTCGLVYSYESGAMNESLSDIIGKAVEFTAKPESAGWQLGNDMGWIIRDLSNPNAYSQPDTYKGTFWYSGPGDNGGVHYNSGVGNFMFYLLVQGGSGTNDKGNNYNVTGIGLAKASQIIYRTQSVYLFPSADYADWSQACINAATDLYGAGSNELAQTLSAWYAVGFGNPAPTAAAAKPAAQFESIYPNPVTNAVTTLKFTLQQPGNVSFKIYNRAGNLLQTYNAGAKAAGLHNYTLARVAELKTGEHYVTIEHNGNVTGRLKFVVLK